jgi:tetratricopeptide (TPR) repeat protein
MRAKLVATLLCLLAVDAALADRETAQFQSGRGDKALAAKKWDDAEACYRKALDEDATFLPARYGLSQALVAEGKTAPAVVELRAFLDAAHAQAALPAEWKTLLVKAEKQLVDLDAAGAALEKITDGYVAELLDLASRSLSKNPELAESLLKRVCSLRPGNAKAVDLLAKIGKTPRSETIDLFDGKDKDGWDAPDDPRWEALDGNFVGSARGQSIHLRTVRCFDGEFDVRMEARLVEDFADGPLLFAIRPCWKSITECYSLGVLRGRVEWWEIAEGYKDHRLVVSLAPTDLKKPFDVKQWNAYELRVRAKDVTALINGDVVATEPRPAGRKDGFVALQVQHARVAFRKVQIELR